MKQSKNSLTPLLAEILGERGGKNTGKLIVKGDSPISYTTGFFFLIVSVCLLLSSCAQPGHNTTQSTTGDKNILRVGVSTNAPPLIFKKGKEITGLEASLARKFAAFSNKKISFVEVPWDKQIDYLLSGKTDIIMSAMTITKARNYMVNFSKPFLRSGQILLVRLGDQRRFSSGLVSLMNSSYKIGTIAGTTGDTLVTSTINGADEIIFKTSNEAVAALIDKKIDALVYDAPMVCYYAALHQADKIIPILNMASEEYLAWAMRKDDIELKKNVDTFLDMMQTSGELTKEINHWIPYLKR